MEPSPLLEEEIVDIQALVFSSDLRSAETRGSTRKRQIPGRGTSTRLPTAALLKELPMEMVFTASATSTTTLSKRRTRPERPDE